MSILRVIFLVVASLLSLNALAQQATSDFWEDPLGQGDDASVVPMPELDVELFHELLRPPISSGADWVTTRLDENIIARLGEFNFAATRYTRRGERWDLPRIAGIELTDALSEREDYNLMAALRYFPGWRNGTLRPSRSPEGGSVTMLATDRAGRLGVRAAAAGELSEGWSYAVAAGRRWGRDAQVQGIFLDQTTFVGAIERRLGSEGSLTLLLAAAPTERSSRTAATAEAFELTGDRLYNPSWGYFDGSERSSRVRRSNVPLGALLLELPIGRQTLDATLAYRTGTSSYSGLAWYDAQSPLPDYYRYLPSFIAEPTASEATAEYWRDRDPRVTQIDWQELSYQNIMAGGQAVYVVSEDVERLDDLRLTASLSGERNRFRWNYGIRTRLATTTNHERLADLMGAEWIVDVDQFLVDDEFYGNQAQNDLRHPDRRVTQGGMFGYHYRMRRDEAGVFGALYERSGNFTWGVSAQGGNVSLQRNGLYEKELYPGDRSFGKSKRATFFDYRIDLHATAHWSMDHRFTATARIENRAPLAADLFLQQRYSNATIDNPLPTALYGGELAYHYVTNPLQIWINAYATLTRDQSEVRHYYDDLSGEYSDLVLSDLSKRYMGLELGAQVLLSPRLRLLVAAALNDYRYAADPRADLFADADGGRIYVGERVPMSDFRLGGTPQTVATGELSYSGPKGWIASATLSYMADHYISPDPTRRMARATAQAASPEAFEAMTSQERFPAAVALGAFVWKGFEIAHHEFAVTLSVDNLLDNRCIVYSGYEPMRLRRSGAGIERTFAPHDSKYLYNRGRTWYASISYRF